MNVTVKKLTNNRCCYAPPIPAAGLHILDGENFNKIFMKFDLPSVEQLKKVCRKNFTRFFIFKLENHLERGLAGVDVE